MNIFVTYPCPKESAFSLPDKHIVKMPLETCQMISIIYSKWYYEWGTIPKKDGSPYETKGGAFRNHPCTIWAGKSHENLAWLIEHGFALCEEYTNRYGKEHSCLNSLKVASEIFKDKTGVSHLEKYPHASDFARAMPDNFKYDKTIDTFESYRRYVASKPWVCNNYIRIPERKPEWV